LQTKIYCKGVLSNILVIISLSRLPDARCKNYQISANLAIVNLAALYFKVYSFRVVNKDILLKFPVKSIIIPAFLVKAARCKREQISQILTHSIWHYYVFIYWQDCRSKSEQFSIKFCKSNRVVLYFKLLVFRVANKNILQCVLSNVLVIIFWVGLPDAKVTKFLQSLKFQSGSIVL